MNAHPLRSQLATLGMGAILCGLDCGQALADNAANAQDTLTSNIGLVSSYRFRGIAQTNGQAAVQGGIDYAATNGLYLGNWNSNVSSGAGYPVGNLEMDFYGGYKFSVQGVSVDVGGLYYYYPGTRLTGAFAGLNQNHPGASSQSHVDNAEIYTALSWEALTLKYAYAVTDYFAQPGTRGTSYLELTASQNLGDGYQLGLHLGRLFMHGLRYLNTDGSTYNGSYTDWKIGVTKDLSGWTLGATYIGTTAQGRCQNGELYCFSSSLNSQGQANGDTHRDAGKATLILSVNRTF